MKKYLKDILHNDWREFQTFFNHYEEAYGEIKFSPEEEAAIYAASLNAQQEIAEYESQYGTPVNAGCTYQNINEQLDCSLNIIRLDAIKRLESTC
mgnify:CR=1 FL=1